MKTRKIFPKRLGFYDTVFSQPLFWGLVLITMGILAAVQYC